MSADDEGTESEYLNSQTDGFCLDEDEDEDGNCPEENKWAFKASLARKLLGTDITEKTVRQLEYAQLVKDLKERYAANRAERVGASCLCPVCRSRFTKRSYQQVFDSTKCKDRYWNTVDLQRRERAKLYS